MIITGSRDRSEEIECGFRAAGFFRIEKIIRGRVMTIKALLKRS